MLGQVHHFVKYNKGVSDYAETRFSTEAKRLYGVLDKRLDGRDYVANEYTIADMAIWPWVSRFEWQEMLVLKPAVQLPDGSPKSANSTEEMLLPAPQFNATTPLELW